ncbi:hypothetical protein T08_12630 [Trichinella sp. T8]|nr:hypothetical protein T08_12630 [Trichinella sp. T8]
MVALFQKKLKRKNQVGCYRVNILGECNYQNSVTDRRAATFLHSSVADRCPVCKASACPDVQKQIMVNGGSWRGRH